MRSQRKRALRDFFGLFRRAETGRSRAKLKPQRRLKYEDPGVGSGRLLSSTRVKYPLHAWLQRPPRGQLRFIAGFNHRLIVRQLWERSGNAAERSIDVPLGAAHIVADFQVGARDAERVPIP